MERTHGRLHVARKRTVRVISLVLVAFAAPGLLVNGLMDGSGVGVSVTCHFRSKNTLIFARMQFSIV